MLLKTRILVGYDDMSGQMCGLKAFFVFVLMDRRVFVFVFVEVFFGTVYGHRVFGFGLGDCCCFFLVLLEAAFVISPQYLRVHGH